MPDAHPDAPNALGPLDVIRLRAERDSAAARAETAEHRVRLLGDALGRLLVALSVVENVELTGPELLSATDAFLAVFDNPVTPEP